MASESDQNADAQPSNGEEKLCLNCLAPNQTDAHFCAKCGAPMTAYAATGPFEHIFAEGHVYRQAAERPRSFIVVLGVWVIFGVTGFMGVVMIVLGRDAAGIKLLAPGGFFLVVSLVMIARTTWNYFSGRRPESTNVQN